MNPSCTFGLLSLALASPALYGQQYEQGEQLNETMSKLAPISPFSTSNHLNEGTVIYQPEHQPWYSGISLNPGLGLRFFRLSIDDRQGGSATLANYGSNLITFSLNMSTSGYSLYEIPHFKLAADLQTYTSFITLDHQYGFESGSNEMGYIDVNTSVKGFYNYIVPTLRAEFNRPGRGTLGLSFGMGLWSAKFKGEMIFSNAGNISSSMETEDISYNTQYTLGYLGSFYYYATPEWKLILTVGGAQSSDNNFDYEVAEAAAIIVRHFTL